MESRDNDEQQPFRTSRELPLDTVCYSKRCVLGDMSIYSEFFLSSTRPRNSRMQTHWA